MSEFTPGKVISFRLPASTPTRVLSQLEELKAKHGRKFSSVISSKFIQTIDEDIKKEKSNDMLVMPMPSGLKDDEKAFLQNEKNQALISQLIIQLLREPNKVASLPETQDKETAKQKTDEKPYFQNNAIQSFAQKTFLNYDDDDDDD